MKRLPSLRPLGATLCAVACGVALASVPAAAWAEPKTFSVDDQLSQDVYSSLGLSTSELDEAAARETAPLDASAEDAATTLLTKNDTYVAANGAQHNKWGLRSTLNRLDSANLTSTVYDDRDGDLRFNVEDDYGVSLGGMEYWSLGKIPNIPIEGYLRQSNLSDNRSGIVRDPTDNGFDGMYATSEACDLGSGWDDCIAELRAYGSSSTTSIDGQNVRGAIAIKVMQLDASGNRTEVATLAPTVNMNQVTTFPDPAGIMGTPSSFDYLEAGYVQERDAYFEVQAADVDNDGVDEIFSYSGAYVDRNGTRYALVDMFDRDGSSNSWNHTVTELDAGRADAYASSQELMDAAKGQDYAYNTQFLKKSPVVTLAGGNLDRRGGEEIAMAVSAPTDHDSPKDAAKCYIYTWDEQSQTLCGVDGLNEEVGGSYLPLFNSAPPSGVSSEAMVSASCTFGTFQLPGAQSTTDALLVAGWDCGNSSHISRESHYSNAAYRYVYYDQGRDGYVVSGYLTRPLGKDAAHIIDTATKDADQDERYVPTMAPFALACARLKGLRQSVENDQVLFGGDVYDFVLTDDQTGGLSTSLGNLSMCSDQFNSASGNTKDKEQVWIGDVTVGNVGSSDNYEESFLGVIGVHRDDDIGGSDDYYWMEVSHFTAKYQGNAGGSDNENAAVYRYESGQEGVVNEGVRRNNTYGTWLSLCLPNASHRGVQAKFEGMAKYYTAPQVLAVLEDAPYFQDLQDSFHYIVLGGTGFEKGEGSSSGGSWGVDIEPGFYFEEQGAFIVKAEFGFEAQARFSYEGQNLRSLHYSVSYDSHAGEGNKVVVYSVPMVYYYYQVFDSAQNDWADMIVPEYLEPTTAIVSDDVWDAAADSVGSPKTSDILSNRSGDPASYTAGAMQKLPGATRAFGSGQNTTTNNSQGATITQTISTEQEDETSLGGGAAIALKLGGGFKIGSLVEASAGAIFGVSGGYSHITSHAKGFTFKGAVDNLPAQADGYGFGWELAVNKSHKEMDTDDLDIDDNQFWIVGYEVNGVTKPQAPAVSGLTATAVTDHSVTLSWDEAELPAGYQYEVAMRDPNGTLSAWQTVGANATSFEWGSQEGKALSPSTTYSFVVRSYDQATQRRGIDSPELRVATLPKGHALTVSGLDVTEPEGASRNAKVPVGGRFAVQESATYGITGEDGSTTYWKPYFSWYRTDLRSGEAELVGLEDGSGVTYDASGTASLRGQLDGFLARQMEQVPGESAGTPQFSTLSVPSVSAADDGSVWRCNVSYNSNLVSSQPVYLDVTHTVASASGQQVSLGRRPFSGSLKSGRKSAFYRVYPDTQVTLVEGSSNRDDGSTPASEDDSGGDDQTDGGAGSQNGGRSAGGSASANDEGSARGGYGASVGSLAQTGDTSVSGAMVCVIAAIAAALISIGWHMRNHRR